MSIRGISFWKGGIHLFLPVLFINSCQTDFDIIAPYKETTVVYGLLDPDTYRSIYKINKAFLEKGCTGHGAANGIDNL